MRAADAPSRARRQRRRVGTAGRCDDGDARDEGEASRAQRVRVIVPIRGDQPEAGEGSGGGIDRHAGSRERRGAGGAVNRV